MAVVWLALLLPAEPGAATLAALWRVPLELPLLVLGLAACPPRLALPVRVGVTAVLVASIVLKLADLGTGAAFRRPFNPVLDAPLVPAAWRLASGALGWLMALAGVLGLLIALALVAWLLWWATGRLTDRARGRTRLPVAALAAAGLGLVAVGASRGTDLPGTASTGRWAAEHVAAAVSARAELAAFRAEAARDPWAHAAPEALLPGLAGVDVLVVFVESYGRSAIEAPLYAPTVLAALHDTDAALAGQGLAARSGFLASPVTGGQSWLAHATLLSGLTIDSEGKYRALLGSPRRTLLHLARQAGWRSAAVMPAITLAWPEAEWFGYDRVLAARDLGYRGAPFGWVTMPDQYTLAAAERDLLADADRPPVMAEIALVSSHAPWTPLPPLVPWEKVGDGSVYTTALRMGEAPEVVWRDEDRIREQYRRAIDYSLRVVGGFAARPSTRPRLLVVLGDHQPAGFVSGAPDDHDVPVHVIGPPALLARLDGWRWTPGMVPAPDAPSWPMAAFRDRFLAAFGTGR
ncbi:MAG: sulfatase [Amaricoccus sp.]|uniref:sulfatase n=1 Tax=Amaricoccus sp. TaxID=1872485 RepID=UPI0039E590E9